MRQSKRSVDRPAGPLTVRFSKLFISLINDAFARSADPSVRNVVNDLVGESSLACLRGTSKSR